MTRPAPSDLVQDSAPAPGLNEHQVRRVRTTFWYVDDLLQGIEALTHPDQSPFVRERPDLSQDEARMLLSFVSLARNRMLAALDRLGIPRPEQTLSARRSAGTGLHFAEIALSELDTRSLRGYGAVDPVAGEEITALSADLQNLMRRGKALLEEQEEGGLAEQVAALTGPAGDVLRRLLEVSTARGLTELRPLIAAAAERATATTLDVGVFGRVSSWKSSLINALVGEGVLPVGATPVTAVPLRVGRGPHSVEVRFRDGRAERIPLSALPELATEERNPQNARGVRSIEVTVPGAPPGLRLLDTPGVGSLASSGSAQAFAWLPRCDLGLVLVAAGTPLGRDETALLSGLRHAGIDCCAVLSKADLLDPDDRERARGYIAAGLVPVLGPNERIDVRAVSTREGPSAGLDALRSEVLVPLASERAQRATDAQRTRLRRLLALTAASLNGGPPASDATAIDFEKERGAAAEAVGKTTDALATSAKRVLEDAAEAVAASWARGEDGAPAFLDAIKKLPPPRLAPGLFRRSRAHSAVDPLLPFLDEALARYAARLDAWGSGALQELRSVGQPTAAADARSPELAGLEALITQVGGPEDAQDRSCEGSQRNGLAAL